MDGRHSYTDDISICCSLSVLLCYCPQKTQSEKLLFLNRKPKPQYHRTKEMTQTRKIPENLHLQQPKAIFFSLLNLDWEAGDYVRHLWELQVESWGLVSKVTHIHTVVFVITKLPRYLPVIMAMFTGSVWHFFFLKEENSRPNFC